MRAFEGEIAYVGTCVRACADLTLMHFFEKSL